MTDEPTILQFIDLFPQFFCLNMVHAVRGNRDRLGARFKIYGELNFLVSWQSR